VLKCGTAFSEFYQFIPHKVKNMLLLKADLLSRKGKDIYGCKKLKRTEIPAASVSLITLLIISLAFPFIFSESAVNLMKIGSISGMKNLLINVFSYMIINIIVNSFMLLFHKQKFNWFKGICLGTIIGSILFFITINLYIGLF